MVLAGARCVGFEKAEAMRGAQADGAGLKTRMPQAQAIRAIRSRRGRGLGACDMDHAASRAVGAAAMINPRISRLLKVKVINAEAL